MTKKFKQNIKSNNSVRVQSGKWNNSNIVFNSRQIKPTGSRIRKTLFDWLRPYVINSTCLDLFAGSGVLGFEALSNGAEKVVAVDINSSTIENLHVYKNKFQANITLVCENYIKFLEMENVNKFDIVFLDPPFDAITLNSILQLKSFKNILAKDAIIYFEEKLNANTIFAKQYIMIHDKYAGEVRYGMLKYN